MASSSTAIRDYLPWTQQGQRHRGRHTTESLNTFENTKPSLDFTQRAEKKLAEYNASDNVFKRWLFEIVSWCISAACMVAIICIYLRIKDHPLSQNESYLNWTNVLGKVSSAALIVPTSEALGQLKWNWFHESKAMWDFEIFDKASRGPLGALMLLFRTKGRSLAALGALLIVLLLAIDTSFQQVVTFPNEWTLHEIPGEIPYVVQYDRPYLMEFQGGWETVVYDTDLLPIVQQYLYRNGSKPVPFGTSFRPDIPLSCPTSNCTWPTYDTLAVCSQCSEVSDLLDITFACLDTTVDWSTNWEGPLSKVPYPQNKVCGHFLNITADLPILLSGYTVNTNSDNIYGETLLLRTLPLTTHLTKERLYGVGSVAFKNTRNPILDALIASTTDGPESVYQNKTPTVHECVLSWCVQTIESSYDLGGYNERIVSSYHNTTIGPNPWISWEIPVEQGGGTWIEYKENITIIPKWIDSNVTKPNDTTIEYGTNIVTASMFMAVFNDFFPASFSVNNVSAIPRLRFKEFMDGPSQRYLPFSPWMAPNNLTRHLEKLATAMTNRVRSSGSSEMLQGEAFYSEQYVVVQWEWLIFPFLLLALSLVFLVLTIIKTSKDTSTGIWKTSAMPTLIYSLPKDAQTKLSPSSTWNDTDKSSGKVRIKLLPNRGWRVSGASHLSTSPQLPRPAVQAPRGWI
ncbi:hypothetical protein AA0119_g1162 [Alternaria tenuissima]|uniref:DUF3176 domain containing protein n=1 Tax=Alternaria tenuissima TaxID=119927 RepID=A0AB37WRM9_9PLEO|nr:hypothetical protein AA0115_g2141 [Alternaria tenuissima]RYN91643.1 hypothetical protein AA0120_g5283 [Alternaria tenuissima]RYO08961.1 hypothetical protein AA0119_g1162 [Alternaria tenuissima]RYO22495.1 hypothetical protein AA0121_g2558 [Alternaria tenuissima]